MGDHSSKIWESVGSSGVSGQVPYYQLSVFVDILNLKQIALVTAHECCEDYWQHYREHLHPDDDEDEDEEDEDDDDDDQDRVMMFYHSDNFIS